MSLSSLSKLVSVCMEEKIGVLRRGCVVHLWHCLGLPNFCDRVRPRSPMRIFIRLLPAALIGLFSRQVCSWEFAYGKKGTVVAIHFHYEHTSSLSLARSPTHSPHASAILPVINLLMFNQNSTFQLLFLFWRYFPILTLRVILLVINNNLLDIKDQNKKHNLVKAFF